MADTPLRPYALPMVAGSAGYNNYLPLDDSTFPQTQRIKAGDLIGSRVLAGNLVFVDSLTVVPTGANNSIGYPFANLAAAQASAAPGNMIVVYPGDYIITAPLGADGVNWWLYPGVTITTQFDPGSDPVVFGDGGNAMSFNVGGFGSLYAAGTNTINNYAGAIVTLNAVSDIRVTANEIASTLSVGGATTAAVNVGAGNVRINAAKIYSTTPGGFGVWWGSDGKGGIIDGGDLHITTPSIESVGGIIKATIANSATNSAYINADHLETTSLTDIGITNISASNEGKLWIKNAGQILANAQTIVSTGGKTYITAQKIAGNTGSGNTSGVVTLSAGGVPKLWLNAEKITYTYGYAINCTDAAAIGQCLNLQAEDLGHGSGAYHRTAGTLNVNFTAI